MAFASLLQAILAMRFGFAEPVPRQGFQPSGSVTRPGEIGSSLPDFTEEDFGGKPISSTHLHGKVVIVDFWATWCQPCRKEMPGFQKLADRYAQAGLMVVGFEVEGMSMPGAQDPRTFAKELGVRYPLIIASPDLQEKFGGIEGLPTTLLYDRDGTLRKKIVGFEYSEAIESYIRDLF